MIRRHKRRSEIINVLHVFTNVHYKRYTGVLQYIYIKVHQIKYTRATINVFTDGWNHFRLHPRHSPRHRWRHHTHVFLGVNSAKYRSAVYDRECGHFRQRQGGLAGECLLVKFLAGFGDDFAGFWGLCSCRFGGFVGQCSELTKLKN